MPQKTTNKIGGEKSNKIALCFNIKMIYMQMVDKGEGLTGTNSIKEENTRTRETTLHYKAENLHFGLNKNDMH